MTNRRARLVLCATLILGISMTACSTPNKGKVCVVLDTGGENDKDVLEMIR